MKSAFAALLLLAPAADAEPKARRSALVSPATAQSLVIEALKRTQQEYADDSCLVSVFVNAGMTYRDTKSMEKKEDADYFYDLFQFFFRSPKRKGFLVQNWCEPIGDVGMMGGPCFGGMSRWWTEDKASHEFSACLDEMSFDSDKAVHKAYKKGLSPRGYTAIGTLAVRTGPLKGKKARLKGKAAWVFREDALNNERCVAFDAKDGREVYDGRCEGLDLLAPRTPPNTHGASPEILPP